MSNQVTELILKNLGRRRGPAIDNSVDQGIANLHTQEKAKQLAAESAQADLNLGETSLANRRAIAEANLAAGADQFTRGQDFRRESFDDRGELRREISSANRGFRGEAFDKRQALEERIFDDLLSSRASRFDDSMEFDDRRFDDLLDFRTSKADSLRDLARGDLRYNKRASNVANLLSALNVGLAGVGSYQESKQRKERSAATDRLIGQYKGMGDAQSEATARLLELIRID